MEVRNSFIELIDLLSDPDKQRQYEKDVPIAHVPAELVCMWCDDLYHPESEQMASQFTADERVDLALFNDCMCEAAELQIDCLIELLEHPKWKLVVAEAQKLISYYQGTKGKQVTR